MSIPQKLDKKTANELRSILSSLNITKNRITIDLNNDTVEIEDEHNINDILQWAGILTPEQGDELIKSIKQNRDEDWD